MSGSSNALEAAAAKRPVVAPFPKQKVVSNSSPVTNLEDEEEEALKRKLVQIREKKAKLESNARFDETSSQQHGAPQSGLGSGFQDDTRIIPGSNR